MQRFQTHSSEHSAGQNTIQFAVAVRWQWGILAQRGDAGLFGFDDLKTDSGSFLFRGFPAGYLQRDFSPFPLDLDGQNTAVIKVDDLLLGKDKLRDQLVCHPIFLLAVAAIVRVSMDS